jgi:hypothetical protein
MDEDRRDKIQLPLALEPAAPRPALVRLAPPAAFLSQLLAERHHLAPQRLKRRASETVAATAYARGAQSAVRRMPAGYRTTRIA